MADLTEIDKAVADERERCALLCEALAGRWALSAQKIREDGTYTTRALWPPFKLVKCVAPKWESVARGTESAAHGLTTVARGIREGWDTRELKPEPIDAERDAALKRMRC